MVEYLSNSTLVQTLPVTIVLPMRHELAFDSGHLGTGVHSVMGVSQVVDPDQVMREEL